MRHRLAAYLAEGDDAAALRAALAGGAPPGPAAGGDGYEPRTRTTGSRGASRGAPDRVVRYAYGAAPLWPAADGRRPPPSRVRRAARPPAAPMPTPAYVLEHDAATSTPSRLLVPREPRRVDAEAVVVRAAPSLRIVLLVGVSSVYYTASLSALPISVRHDNRRPKDTD